MKLVCRPCAGGTPAYCLYTVSCLSLCIQVHPSSIISCSPWPLFVVVVSTRISAHIMVTIPPRHGLPLRVASSSNCVSTAPVGICTYLTTDPLIKQFLIAICIIQQRYHISTTSAFASLFACLGKTNHMRESFWIGDLDVIQSNVQEPSRTITESARCCPTCCRNAKVVFELHRHYLLCERFEDPTERKDYAKVSFGSVASSVVPPLRLITHENIS
jgi:hypothetical protein